ncbi:MBL fold metallo-hydrolase [Amycolatopsis rhabdoformis]|uniref:Coenzyme PQQ synthesis protein B n=1 Tax=Amycolatopsis rhabdoformis TaxID=1448059 RepID=A0ABZ1ICJ7_9PSEU|nr:MBL fold metallo-hydrolase [Amycolatopsis rhabdoformis]WSE32150.1 MBL fold metallo-hydrolase [Amycolatopsis rhabdoformis]
MKVRFLGTAAGGGAPQWNCGCTTCGKARRAGVSRTQDCLAVTGDGESWYLVNASPDLRTQLLATPELAPTAGSRDSPVRGVVFTSAELDHTIGLLTLREAGSLDVFATATVHEALRSGFPVETAVGAYTRLREHRLVPGTPMELAGGLRVTCTVLSAKKPRYAAAGTSGEWVSACRFDTGPRGGSLVYAPGLAAWTDAFSRVIADADVVVLDGTFLTEQEMGPARPASGMGHLAIGEVLPFLAGHPGPRYLFTHLNNTNPLVLPGALEASTLAEVNAAVAFDGQLLEL